jgi:threonine synthase
MDILISSNLERMIYSLVGRDDVKTKELMEQLTKKGKYSIDDNEKMKLSDFVGKYATEEQTSEIIKYVYDKSEYLIDTHTAVAAYAAYEYKRETLDEHPMMIVSTASPYKFTRSVMNSLDLSYDKMTDFELVDEMKKVSEVDIPNAIEEIRKAKVLHKTVCGKNDMEKVVKDILNIK